MKPIPRINAMIPSIISSIPRPALSPISAIPPKSSPRPKIQDQKS